MRSSAPRASFALLAFVLGCSSEPAAPPLTTALALDFAHVIDGEPIVVGAPYTTRYGQEVTFGHVRYWVTEVALARGEERYGAPGSYFLVEQTEDHDKLSITACGIPAGTYDGLILHIGVDPPHNNNKNPELAEGELRAGVGMDWATGQGYTFFSTEGHFTQGDLSGDFSFQIGTDVLYKELRAQLAEPITLIEGGEARLSLKAEIDRIFAGVQLATAAQIEGGTVDSPAAQVAGNYSRMFRLVTNEDEIPLTATSPNVDVAPDDGTIPADSTPPVLSEPVVALNDALVCSDIPDRPASEERACVTPFDLASTSVAAYDAGFFTFVTKNGEPVRASAAGVVTDVIYMSHSDLTHSDLFTVSIRPNQDSAFWMEYRNVKDLKVAEGDMVTPGHVLGGAGDYFNEAIGLVSFGVRRHQEVVQRLCPTRFATPELEATYSSALSMSNEAWPAFMHGSLCSSTSLVCLGGACEASADFAPVKGDIDEGRRIYREGCASCHGDKGQGGIAPKLCSGSGCACKACLDHESLAARIHLDMPPEGFCDSKCSADVAAFILRDFIAP